MVDHGATRVTILLSTFDGRRWLPDLLDSLAAQTHTEWVLRVRDDGSTDGTVDLVRSAADRDGRIELFEQGTGAPLGASASFMRLLATVDTPIFAFCDQDDIWLPDRLARAAAAIDGGGHDRIAAVATDAVMVDTHDTHVLAPSALAEMGITGRPRFGRLLMNNVAIGATLAGTGALARRAVALSGATVPLWHDWWVALVAAYEGDLAIDPTPTIRWRRHPDALTSSAPPGVAGRLRRRRRYVEWSIDAARILRDDGVPVDDDAATAVGSLGALDPAHPTIRGLVRAWYDGGVRARTRRGQLATLAATRLGRTDHCEDSVT